MINQTQQTTVEYDSIEKLLNKYPSKIALSTLRTLTTPQIKRYFGGWEKLVQVYPKYAMSLFRGESLVDLGRAFIQEYANCANPEINEMIQEVKESLDATRYNDPMAKSPTEPTKNRVESRNNGSWDNLVRLLEESA